MYRKNAWENLAEDEKEQLSAFAKDYMAFLNNGKTERECVAEGVRQAEAKGFKNLLDVVKNGETLKAGDRVYRAWMNKDIMLFIIGEKPMECGMNILGAHIDSPRIDIKQNPLYEELTRSLTDFNFAFLAPLALGLVAGILLTTRILERAMDNHPRATYMIILGFVLGSLFEVFPGVPQGWELLISLVTFALGFAAVYALSWQETHAKQA